MIGEAIAALIPWDALAWAAGALVAIAGAWIAGRRSGAVRAKIDDLEQTVEALEGRNEVDNRIATDPDPKRRLLRDWSE